MIKSFHDLLNMAKKEEKKVLSVAAAHDEEVMQAVSRATSEGIVEPILVGFKDEIERIAGEIGFDISNIEIIDCEDDLACAREATSLVHSGRADILMKGLVGTADILRQVLNKEYGLRTGRALSQVAIFETVHYHKMFMVTDPAMNIAPDLATKKQILENAVELAHALEIDRPKVAVLAAMEKVSESMQATVDGESLTQMYEDGEIRDCIVYGPLALDNAVSKESARIKKIDSEVAGDADILLVPHIDAGNMLYKSLTFLGGSASAGIVIGASAPIVLTSRADNHFAKFNSIALAVMLASK